jgi:hypothetical protein
LAGIIAGGVARAAIGREGGGPLPLLGAVFGWQAVTVVAAVMGIVRRGGRSAGTAPPAGD